MWYDKHPTTICKSRRGNGHSLLLRILRTHELNRLPRGISIWDTVNKLQTGERAMLITRFGLRGNPPLTQPDTATHFGLTVAAVDCIESQAIQSLIRAFPAEMFTERK